MTATKTATETETDADKYVVLDVGLAVWARPAPHYGSPHRAQTIDLARGQVIEHPEYLGDGATAAEGAADSVHIIDRLLALGVIAHKVDVDSGEVVANCARPSSGHRQPCNGRTARGSWLAGSRSSRSADRAVGPCCNVR